MIPYMNLNEQVDADFTPACERRWPVSEGSTPQTGCSPSTTSEEGASWLATASTEGLGS
jgi:hypothetical protein